ncbi:hypothetical protein [Streptomyces griseocarneus]|uniref:hypothetical protein n=1 Tax=Streptomyces griseocarneus TaxID=51201 RepID=UPI00167D8D6A|nr:hypothetical protein [Streptomyces griseocarneus]MBZ6478032.1 hypothetical protein [Streptomyces griseocarneus]GHG64153.1 hypothetical protein GCM10018779_33880 [Streptomyces griseocarneus]
MADRKDGQDRGKLGGGLFITSAVFILLVVVLGVFVVVTDDDDAKGGNSAASGASATPAPPASGGGNGSSSAPQKPADGSCAPTDTDSKVPTVAPKDVTWEIVNSAVLPRSKSAGPMKFDGLTASCYAHTPRGALMASINGYYRSIVALPDSKPMKEMLLPGPGRDKLLEGAKQITQPVPTGDLAQLAGFQVVTYTAETAVVSLVNGEAAGRTLKVFQVTVRWADGDWKVVPADDGHLTSSINSISDMTGYTQFRGL